MSGVHGVCGACGVCVAHEGMDYWFLQVHMSGVHGACGACGVRGACVMRV